MSKTQSENRQVQSPISNRSPFGTGHLDGKVPVATMNRKKSAFAPSRSRVQRFRKTIRKQGPNPYVDIPERVRCAFADYARVGRISVEGKLNQTAIRGTLIAVGTGGIVSMSMPACEALQGNRG